MNFDAIFEGDAFHVTKYWPLIGQNHFSDLIRISNTKMDQNLCLPVRQRSHIADPFS